MKTVAPTRVNTFLGITLDTVLMDARLPEDKLEKVTIRDLQLLIGILNFACTVIVPCRAFLRRIIDMIVGVQKPHHHIRLNRQESSIYRYGRSSWFNLMSGPFT